MGITLRGASGVVEVYWPWEAPREGLRQLRFHDRAHARACLARLADLTALRRFVRERLSTPAYRVEDAALLDEVASWVAGGRLHVATRAPTLLGLGAPKTEAPAASAAADAPAPAETVEVAVEPSTFPADIDAPAIAAAMREAARDGVPFCEQCLRKKLAKQRAVAQHAAPDGAAT